MKTVKVWLYGEVVADIKVNALCSKDSVYDWLVSEGYNVDIIISD